MEFDRTLQLIERGARRPSARCPTSSGCWPTGCGRRRAA